MKFFFINIDSALVLSHFKNVLLPIIPYLITSAIPDTNSFFGRVLCYEVSIIMTSGCLKLPIKFLPSEWLIPDLPPTEESTWASRVVGICIKLTPLRNVSAEKLAKSPITPPPKAIMVKSLPYLFFIN